MNILLLDASSEITSFGLSKNGEIVFQNELNSENNADSLTYEVKNRFNSSGLSFEDIDYISLSNGPGSFTGLRISSAVAKGMCYSLDKKLIEINSLDILADSVITENSTQKIIPLISSNMRTGEFYFAEYVREHNDLNRTSEYRMETIGSVSKDAIIVSRKNLSESLDIRKVSKEQEMASQNRLSLLKIENKQFADIMTSEPFYIKDFVPLKKQ